MLSENLEKKSLERIFGKYDSKIEIMVLSLNYYLGKNTIKVLNSILNNCGISGNNIGFFFPGSFDPWDEESFKEGVMFQWGIKGIIVDNQTFYKYLKRSVNKFIELFPGEKTKTLKLLKNIKTKYKCSDRKSKDIVLRELKFND